MRQYFIYLILLLISVPASAQNVGIGVPNPGAKLEVAGGVKISDSIFVGGQVRILSGTPGAGKVLTSNATGVASWVSPAAGGIHYIGEQFGGGVVFHLWKDNLGVEHGLVVATTNQSTSQAWSNISTVLIGATAQSSWDGLSNSNAIVAQSGHTGSAAKLCLDLVAGGQSDWYLPAIDELSLLWHNRFNVNKTLSTIGGATVLPFSANYWSSAEAAASYAWVQSFANGTQDYFFKTTTYYVRAVRAF